MVAKLWRKAGIFTALVAVVSMLPGAAQASHPYVNSAEVFGAAQPNVDLAKSQTLFANSLPFGPAASDAGKAWIRGVASPGDYVVVSADDNDPSTAPILATTTTEAALTNNGLPNPDAGKFLTSMYVNDLGTHLATPGGQTSTDPSKWGPSLITFTIRARKASTGQLSDPVTRTLTKYAGTPNDTSAPKVQTRNGAAQVKWPPTFWCHNAPAVIGTSMTNNTEGNYRASLAGCSTAAAAGVYFLGGAISDAINAQWAIYSEIGDITITVTGGSLPDPIVYHSVGRAGPGAGYGLNLYRKDFPPNVDELFQISPSYTITVVGIDAWRNQYTASSTFDVCTC